MRYSAERGLLKLHEPPAGSLLFLCWPVLVYRVTAPVLRVRQLDIFEKVVMGLCRAGIRGPDHIAALIHRDRTLVEYVMSQLRAAGRLDKSGAPTAEGVRTNQTGLLDEAPELIVTHVFQDPFTGELWPRSVPDLNYQPVQQVRDKEVDLRLATAGHPRRETALLVSPEPLPLSPPAPEQIIGAVTAHRAALAKHRAEQFAENPTGSGAGLLAQQELQALSTELHLPADVRSVVDVREPVPEFLLAWLDLQPAGEPGPGGWRARDPFGLDPSLMLQHLVSVRMSADATLAAAVTGIAERADEQIHENYRRLGGRVRQSAEAALVRSLGGGIRSHPAMLELLLGLEEAAVRAPDPAAVEAVSQGALRTYEHLFRRLVVEYPPVPPRWLQGSQVPANAIIIEHVGRYAADLGFSGVPSVIRNQLREFAVQLRSLPNDQTMEKLGQKFARQLIPFALVAAADADSPHRAVHPLRGLGERRPALLSELYGMQDKLELNALRNRGSHADRDASVAADIAWCRELALDAARTVLAMPPQPQERTPV